MKHPLSQNNHRHEVLNTKGHSLQGGILVEQYDMYSKIIKIKVQLLELAPFHRSKSVFLKSMHVYEFKDENAS